MVREPAAMRRRVRRMDVRLMTGRHAVVIRSLAQRRRMKANRRREAVLEKGRAKEIVVGRTATGDSSETTRRDGGSAWRARLRHRPAPLASAHSIALLSPIARPALAVLSLLSRPSSF